MDVHVKSEYGSRKQERLRDVEKNTRSDVMNATCLQKSERDTRNYKECRASILYYVS